jgi:hypothetical protein
VTTAFNFVDGIDKNTVLVRFFQHLKLSKQKTHQKHAEKFVVNTNLRLRDKIFPFLTLAGPIEKKVLYKTNKTLFCISSKLIPSYAFHLKPNFFEP